MSPEIVFTLVYILLCVCIIYPPTECVSAGLTIPAIFSSLLGSEEEQFIMHNIKRSLLTLFIYSLIPIGYILGLLLFVYQENLQMSFAILFDHSLFWKIFLTSSIVLPLIALYYIKNCSRDNWKNHPIVVNLTKFCNNNTDWENVASDINREYRRIDKICLNPNTITKIIATENWIIKVTPLALFLAYQSDTSLIVIQADTHYLSHQSVNEVQYVNIEVKSSRSNVDPFTIRINALDFKDLEDRIARSIAVLPSVKFHKTIVEQFIDAFKDVVKNNPTYLTDQRVEQCIGCLQNEPNVKIQRLCENEGSGEIFHNNERCETCYCRPMWCVDCLAKWFVSKQDSVHSSTWLNSKCTCPMCRAKFCMLDVCMIEYSS